jgi:gentisate 1,2-dioxygenase
MVDTMARKQRSDAPFIAELEAANFHPVWDRFKKITPLRPQAADAPFIWRWRDMEPLLNRAVAEVPIEDIERRAIIMVNPAFGGETVTTSNLIAAFTVLDPGDRARPHRHTFSAIRFATQSEGAATIVNGRRCEMKSGDLILTPPMCWHGHINDSDHRIFWFDAANLPLIRALDANFFEPGDAGTSEFWHVDAGEERNWSASGLIAADEQQALAHSPKYHYPGTETRRTLAAVRPGPDGSRAVRYVNPATGRSVMPAFDCAATRLTKSVATRPKRVTYNSICLVVSGAGRSNIGERTFEWSQNDVFTVPHWTWASHEAIDADADLFVVSDRVVHEQLGLLREELQ